MGQKIFHGLFERLPDYPAGFRVTLQYGTHKVAGLFEGDMRWQRRNIGIGVSVNDHWSVRAQGRLPDLRDLAGMIEQNAAQTQRLGVIRVGEVR